ncbi:alpha-L-fucosidase [Bacteroides sedimenti]
MNKNLRIITLSLLAIFTIGTSNAQSFQESKEQKEKRMQWFQDAKLGVFIHWGIYAVRGIPESWSFYNGYLSYDEYMSQLNGFTAKNYDPVAWAKLIKESGAQYTVITSKHHDGVALWDTQASDLSLVKKSPAARDLLTPFTKAVRNEGMKLGIYYSLLDWSCKDYPHETRTSMRYQVKDDPARWERFLEFDKKQLTELNKQYKPDLYWFDGDWDFNSATWKAKDMASMLRSYNPNVILNSRIQGYGDYETPEQGVPIRRPASPWWELCMTMNDSWGYAPTDTNYKSANMLLRTFVDCLSNGGNLLLDIGPKEDGTIPQEQVDILKEFGRWTKKHADAIYGTRAGIPEGHVMGYTALNKNQDILYIYLPYKPIGPISVKGLKNKVNRAWIVGNGALLETKVVGKAYWSSVPGILYFDVPEQVQDPQITVVALLLDGKIDLYREAGQVITSN